MVSTQRQQQKVEELCGASIRALTGQPDLRYRGRRLHKGRVPVAVRTPHLRTDPDKDDFASYRGAADGIALRLLLSDAELHRRLSPKEPVARFVFELLEQLRVEALVPERLPGMKRNLRYRFSHWSAEFHRARLTENHVGLLIYTLGQVVWSRLNAYPVLEETEDLIEATRFGLTPIIGKPLLTLRRQRESQSGYAEAALQIAAAIQEMVEQANLDELGDENPDDESRDEDSELSLLLEWESDEDLDPIASANSGESRVLAEAKTGYQVFSRRYDREVRAASLVREAYLRESRQRLDERVRGQGVNIPRLARRLAALLAAPQRDGWRFGEEEGYIDARRLTQLITSPSERRLFRQEQYKLQANSLVSILIDCSGSMKEHIEKVAVLVDVLGRALEQAGVDSEILGYTTGAWNGGRCQQEWMSRGRPKHPGRLNELCHMVYKDADTSWRRARQSIAALLKADLFREGIDGEALEWAARRMLDHDAERRILIVISDGCPMDTATNLCNDQYYLDNHLKQVVARLEYEGRVDVYGLGVGLDLSPYYTHSLAVDLSQTISNQVFEEVLQLLAGRHHR